MKKERKRNVEKERDIKGERDEEGTITQCRADEVHGCDKCRDRRELPDKCRFQFILPVRNDARGNSKLDGAREKRETKIQKKKEVDRDKRLIKSQIERNKKERRNKEGDTQQEINRERRNKEGETQQENDREQNGVKTEVEKVMQSVIKTKKTRKDYKNFSSKQLCI